MLDPVGKNFILVDTERVRLDKVDVGKITHTTVFVVSPLMGDDTEAKKAGILETGDIFVIKKTDGERGEGTLGDLWVMLALVHEKSEKGK